LSVSIVAWSFGAARKKLGNTRVLVASWMLMGISNLFTAAVLVALALAAVPASAQRRGRGGHVSGTGVRASGTGVRASGTRVVRGGSAPRSMTPYYAFRRRVSVGPGLWVGYPIAYPGWAFPAPYAGGYPYPEFPQGSGPVDQDPSAGPAGGQLELALEPSAAQVYIDGYYVGTVSDFNRPGGLSVEAGPHHVEIRAPGYQASSFEVRLLPDQPVTYREDLQPLNGGEPARSASARSAAAPTTTFYVISGCYLGNVPPTDVALPPGCDRSQVKTFDPHR
jgi:PEGA domain